MWLVVGLGNPGKQYEATRHNLGFMVVDELLRRTGHAPPHTKFGALLSETQLGHERVIFCKPMKFMNMSGQALTRAAQFWKIPPEQTIVIHDDLDLSLYRLKLGIAGGHGGHNGLRSILVEWGTADFYRVRVGIGRPTPDQDSAAYVLSNFSCEEWPRIPAFLARAADAVEAIVGDGPIAAMNKFNPKKPIPESL